MLISRESSGKGQNFTSLEIACAGELMANRNFNSFTHELQQHLRSKIMKNIALSSVFCFLVFHSSPAQDVRMVEGSTIKIEQLIGDFDKERGIAVANQTQSRYGLGFTDLGVAFEHKDKIYIAFGDIPDNSDRDPIAWTTDRNPEDGLSLNFLTNDLNEYITLEVPGENLGAFEVPVEGLSYNGNIYLYCTTDNMGRSFLAKSTDDGYNFEKLYDVSSSKFINLSLVKFSSGVDFPEPPGTDMHVILGSGEYRKSHAYLACQRADEVENNCLRYFSGIADYKPVWTEDENLAVPVFEQGCVGELSLSYNTFIGKWIVLYNCDSPRGINCRTADKAWGPWSEPFVVFDPWEDNGYCHFIHTSKEFSDCDNVHDEGRENEWGGEYGPYQFESLASGTGNETTIYYTLSTWNPYTVVLMKSVLIRENTSAEHVRKERKAEIFPNPAKDYLHLRLAPGYADSYRIYTIQGSLLSAGEIHSIDGMDFSVHVSDLQEGFYFLNLFRKGQNVSCHKFVHTRN